MYKNVTIMLEKKLQKEISIDKLGILFRPLSDIEKNDILLKYDELFFNKKAQTIIKNVLEQKYSKDYTIYNKRKLNILQSYSDEQRIAAFMYDSYIKDNIIFTKKIIKQQLNKIVVVEMNEKITDYVDKDLEFIFISNIIKIMLYKNGYDLKLLKDMFICSPHFDIFSEEFNKKNSIILNYINLQCPKIIEELKLDYWNFNQINQFINSLSVNRIRDFSIAIDYILSKNSSIDNLILNYVSCIERILVKGDKEGKYDIGKQIYLKYGLCITDNKFSDVDTHINMVKYCYEIRSCIIHGNDDDLIIAPQKILKITKKEIEEGIKSNKYSNNRFYNIFLANNYLESYLYVLFKEWIENTNRIEFLKNN